MPTPARKAADQLIALGAKVPKRLADELAVLDAAINYAPPQPPDISFEALTVSAKDVPNLIEQHVEAIIRRDAANLAKGELRDRLERRARRALDTTAEEITGALAPIWTKAADDFTAAFDRLPSGWRDDSVIVRAGTSALEALTEAQRHAPVLEACRRIRDLLDLDDDTPLARGTRFTVVSDSMVAEEVARQSQTGTLGWFGNALTVDGCDALQWHATEAAHRAYLATVTHAELKPVRNTDDGFHGVQLRKVVSA